MITRVAIFIALINVVSQSTVAASDSAYCDKVRARANGDAALLLSPRLFVQALRFPFSADVGMEANKNFQLRVGLSFSPIDFYRGFKVMDASDADCEAFESRGNLNRILTNGTETQSLSAYKAQIAFLEAHRAQWQTLRDRAQQRFDARIITVVEFEEFFRRTDTLEHKLEDARGQAARLDARGVQPSHDRIDRLETTYIDTDEVLESRMSNLKSLDAWNFKIFGGGIPSTNQPLGWFGWIEISYSFGNPFQSLQESSYLKARRAEVRNAAYEVPSRIRALRVDARARLSHARRELSLVEDHLSLLVRAKSILEAANTQAAIHEQDTIVIEQLLAESDQVFWSELFGELTKFLRKDDG